MTRGTRQRGVCCWVYILGLLAPFGVLAMTAGSSSATAQEPVAEAQPAPGGERVRPSREEVLRRLEELRRQQGDQPTTPPPPPPPPEVEPAEVEPELDENGEVLPEGEVMPEGEGIEDAPAPDTQPGPPGRAGAVSGGPPRGQRDVEADIQRRAAELGRVRDAARGQRGGATPGPAVAPRTGTGNTVVIDAPTTAPQGDGEHWFQYDGRAWEDVVKDFARRLGKPLMDADNLVIGGELTYLTNRTFSRAEALDELNFLLHEKGFHFVEERDRIRVVPIMEMPQWVSLDRVFADVALFHAANLRDMEYCVVYVTIEGRNAQDVVDMFGTNLPIDLLLSVWGSTNKVRASGVARDIRRFLSLVEQVSTDKNDPRVMRIIKTRSNVRVVENMVRALYGAGGGTAGRRFNRQTGQWEMTGGADTELQITADDRINSLVIRGLPEQVREIEVLLAEIDREISIGEFTTRVIEIKYASATEVANVINQIFAQEQGESASPGWQQMRNLQIQRARMAAQAAAARRGQPGQPVPQPQMPAMTGASPEDVLGEDIMEKANKTIRIVPFERTNSIAVYANEEGHKRVAETLERIDVPQPTNFRTFKLENVKVEEVSDTIVQLVNDFTSVGRSGMRRPSVLPDPAGNQLHVMADPDVMQNIEDIIKRLDVAAPERARHVVQLKYVRPSEMVALIQSFVGSGGGAARPAAAARRPGMRMPVATGAVSSGDVQMVPIDQSQTLVVICAEAEWPEIEEIIGLADTEAVTNTPVLQTYDVQVGDARAIASVLQQFYRVYERPPFPRTPVLIYAEEGKVFVQAIKPAQEEIGALIAAMDVKPAQNPVVILPLKHADANAVASHLQSIMAQAVRARGVSAPNIQAESVTNSLIVQADRNDMERIQTFAQEMDERIGAQASVQRFFNLVYVQPQNAANAIQTFFNNAGSTARGRFMGMNVGTQVKAVASGKQLVVEAPAEAMKQIEAFIAQLDNPSAIGNIAIKTIKLQGADVAVIANKLNTAFQAKAQQQGVIARFDPDPSSGTILLTVSNDILPEAEKLLAEYAEAYANRVTLVTEVRRLPGLEVQQLASTLNTTFAQKQPRSDGLRPSFVPDALTESIVISAPPDMWSEIDKLVAVFLDDAERLVPVQEFILIEHTDATYVANQVRALLPKQVSQRQGTTVASRISVEVDAPRNRVVISAPKFVMPLAHTLIAELDVKTDPVAPAVTIALTAADATAVAQTLQPLYAERARQKRNDPAYVQATIQPDALTNSLLVMASKEDLEEIQREAKRIDEVWASDDIKPVQISLRFADPNEMVQTINSIYGRRRAVGPGQDVLALVSNNTLVIKAPPGKLDEIQEMVAAIDSEDPRRLEIRTFTLQTLNAPAIAAQVNVYLASAGGNQRRGSMRPGAFAEPATNTLVVLAPADLLPMVETMVRGLDTLPVPTGAQRPYELRNARAEQVAPTVEALLRAKAAESAARGRGVAPSIAVQYDERTNRVLVLAPEELHGVAAEIINMLDGEASSGEIMHIVSLDQADAAALAQTLTQMASGGLTGGARRPGGRAGNLQNVTIVADAGSNSLVLRGLPQDVAEVEALITELESRGSQIPELRIFDFAHASATDVHDALKAMFPAARDPAETVTLTLDEYGNRLIVTASRRKMRQVEGYVTLLDADPGERSLTALPGGQQIYFVDVYRGDAFDIAWNVSSVLPDKGPQVEADWFGEYITVTCRPSEFAQVEELIRQFDRRSKVETTAKVRQLRGDKQRTLQYLAQQFPNVTIEQADVPAVDDTSLIIDVWPAGEQPPVYKRKQQERSERRAGQTRVFPVILAAQALAGVRQDVVALVSDEQPAPAPTTAPAAADTAAPTERSAAADDLERPKVEVKVLPNDTLIFSGPKAAVSDLDKAVDLLEEDLKVGEVVRIFRFQYGDVNAAAEILDRMFNDRQVVITQPQQQPQRDPRQQQGDRGQQNMMMEQLRMMMGQGGGAGGARAAGGPRLRIATDPSRNYLIVKCDAADLADIQQLLRILDDIPDVDVRVQTFKLRNIDATETANNIKEVLGLTRARGGATAGRRGAAGGAPNQQQQLMMMLEQQMVSIAGSEGVGAKVESVEIVPNTATNAVLVSAPDEVMEIIEGVLADLEAVEPGDLVGIHHYVLKNARVDDVLPLLQGLFADATSGGGGARRGQSPAALGAVTLSADPRSNTIIFAAESKDVPLVEAQIAMLDIPGNITDAESYVCQFGDAQGIADVVTALYTGQAARPGGGRGGPVAGAGAAAAVTADIRIVAEPLTNTIVVWGPAARRELILASIEELDLRSRSAFREVPVQHADAEDLAATLTQMFAGGGAPVTSRVGWRQNVRASARPDAAGGLRGVVIVGNSNAKKLLIKAPDALFPQIEEVIAAFDIPDAGLQIRRFDLVHANAESVVDSLRGALQEFMQFAMQRGEMPSIDAFTVVPDARTNSIVVVGSEKTFAFVHTVLAGVDVATPENQQTDFRVFALEAADATTVADAINSVAGGLSATRRTGTTPTPPRGRMGTMGGMGGATPGSGGGELRVTATAETATNSVLVFGVKKDIDEIEQTVIRPLEQSVAASLTPVTIPVQYAAPSQVASFIRQFLATPTGQTGGQPGRATATPGEGPHLIPNDAAKLLVVRGTPAQVERIRVLVQQFDDPQIVQTPVRVIEVPFGQSAVDLASQVERIVNEGERIMAEQQLRTARLVAVGADDFTNTLIVSGDPTTFGHVEGVVAQLIQIGGTGRYAQRVIELRNLPARDAARIIEQIQQQQRGTGGTARPTGGRPSTPNTQRRTGGGRTRPDDAFGRDPAELGSSGAPLVWTTVIAPVLTARLIDDLTDGTDPLPASLAPVAANRPAADAAPAAPTPPAVTPPPARQDPAPAMAATGVRALADAMRMLEGDSPARPLAPPAVPPRRVSTPPATRPAPTSRPQVRFVAATGARALEDAVRELEDDAPPARRTPPTRRAVDAAPARPAQPVAPADQPAAPPPPPASEPAAAEPPLGAGVDMAVAGHLRSEVSVIELDAGKVIISGLEDDLDFLEALLRSMDLAAPRPEVRVFQLQEAKATALVRIVQEAVKNQVDARTGGSPGAADQFSITAEARSNSLIVAASEANMELIAMIIEKLDVPGERGQVSPRSVALVHITAAEAKAQLTPVIERLNRLREVPAESQASIEAVHRSNSVLIIGTPADINEIEALVKAIDVDVADAGSQLGLVAEMIIVSLQNGQATDVATVLSDMITAEQDAARSAVGAQQPGAPTARKLQLTAPDGRELPALDLEKPIRLIPEKGTNSIIVFSTQPNNVALREIIDVFDTLPLGAETDVKAFVLRYATAAQVAELLQTVFDDGRTALSRPTEGGQPGSGVMPPQPPGVAAKGLPYQVALTYDARSNTVIVVGRREAVLLATGLIQEIDRPGDQLGIQSYLIELKHVQASTLEPKLTELLGERAEALGTDAAARDVAVIKADDRSNKLIVVANEDVYRMVHDLALGLDTADGYRVVDTHYRALQYADAIKLQQLIEEVFQAKIDANAQTQADTRDALSVTADPRSNALVLTGTREYLDEALELVARLDQRFDSTVAFKRFKPKLNSAANMATLLQELVDKTLAQAGGKLTGSPIQISVDRLSDSLLVAAAAEDLALLEQWIEIIDRPAEIGTMTRIIPLRNRQAEELARSVQELFRSTGDTAGGGVVATHEATTNSIVVSGPPALLGDVEDLVRRLDSVDPERIAELRVFKLQQADAGDAGELLVNLLELRGGNVGGTTGAAGAGSRQEAAKQVMLLYQQRHPEFGTQTLRAMRQDVTVTADVRTNSLFIAAPKESMPLMESLVATIDVPPDAAKIRIFPLRNSAAEEMVTMLDELFSARTTGTRSTTSGTGTDAERQLVLEGGLDGGGRQEITFTPDPRTNAVIAAGTPGYLDLVEEFLFTLDSSIPAERKTMVYAPRNTPAASLVESVRAFSDAQRQQLEDLGGEISSQRKQQSEILAIANEDSGRVVLNYDPRRESEVFDIVQQLDQAPPQVSIEVLIVEVSMDNTLDLGVEFAAQDLQWAKAGPNDTTSFDYVAGTDIGAAGTGLGGFSFTITGRDFNFLIRTLQVQSGLRVLSRPHIVAMDNQDARIEIVDDVPYVSSTSTSTAGQITTSVSRQKVGIKLNVRPQINPDGFVRLEVTQEVSNLTNSTVNVGPGLTAPIFQERTAETVITVKDNETVVLGGLITSTESRTENKVPLVGDVPVLGSLFRYDKDETKRTELLVILTPRIIRTIEDFRETSVAQRDTSGIIPAEVLTNPLMRGLQVQPELLPEELPPGFESPADRPEDEYGPLGDLRTLRHDLRGQPAPTSYDLPLPLRAEAESRR